MTDLDPWSMTDMDVAQMCGQDAQSSAQDVPLPNEWVPTMPGFDADFDAADSAGGLPSFSTPAEPVPADQAPATADYPAQPTPAPPETPAEPEWLSFSSEDPAVPEPSADSGESLSTSHPNLDTPPPESAPAIPESPAAAPVASARATVRRRPPAVPLDGGERPQPASDPDLQGPAVVPPTAPFAPPRTEHEPEWDASPVQSESAQPSRGVVAVPAEHLTAETSPNPWATTAAPASEPHSVGAPASVPVGGPIESESSAGVRPSARVPVSPRATPAPVAVPVPDRDARTIVDDQELAKDPEKGLSGVRRRMGRRLGSKQLPPEQLTKNLKKPLPRPVVVAFVQHAGGDGKSTLSAAVGQQIATHRRDRVIAIDAAVAAGGLSQRLPVQNESTIQTLLSNLPSIHRWSDAREHTSQGRTGLELLTSGDSIADDAVLTAAGYERVIDVLTANDTYNLLLVDCDAGVTGELKDAILDSADVIVVPAAGRDGVSGAVVTMNRLMYLADKYPHRASHYRGLISTAVIALNHIAPKSILRDDEVGEMFRERVGVREVVSVPFDPTLKDGSEVDIMLASKATSNALLQLAAEVVTSLRRSV